MPLLPLSNHRYLNNQKPYHIHLAINLRAESKQNQIRSHSSVVHSESDKISIKHLNKNFELM